MLRSNGNQNMDSARDLKLNPNLDRICPHTTAETRQHEDKTKMNTNESEGDNHKIQISRLIGDKVKKSQQTKPKTHFCKDCKIWFRGMAELQRHLKYTKLHHKSSPAFICACKDSFTRKDALIVYSISFFY